MSPSPRGTESLAARPYCLCPRQTATGMRKDEDRLRQCGREQHADGQVNSHGMESSQELPHWLSVDVPW
jgi:hypothetical protein